MELKDFNIVKNRARPDFCYAYEFYTDNRQEKYSIFTMDGGRNFLASVTVTNALGKLTQTDYSESFTSVEEALNGIKIFLNR